MRTSEASGGKSTHKRTWLRNAKSRNFVVSLRMDGSIIINGSYGNGLLHEVIFRHSAHVPMARPYTIHVGNQNFENINVITDCSRTLMHHIHLYDILKKAQHALIVKQSSLEAPGVPRTLLQIM